MFRIDRKNFRLICNVLLKIALAQVEKVEKLIRFEKSPILGPPHLASHNRRFWADLGQN